MTLKWTQIFTALICGIVQGTAVAETTFIYCPEGSPSTFNPQLASDGTTFNASGRPIYNRLVEFKSGGTELQPSLAESWTVSKDGRIYNFKLRPDVQFHTTAYFKPTRPLSSRDVVFSFERMRNRNHPYHSVNGGSYQYFQSMGMGELIEKIEAVDPLNVRFTLKHNETPFLANLAMDYASILSAEYADALTEQKGQERIDTQPVGTGPFIFKSYSKDSQIRYDAFVAHFAGSPRINRLVFAITPDPSVRFQKLRAGECHLIAEPAPQDLPKLNTTPKVKVISQPGLNVGYLAMNTQKPPLNRLEVRQAIAHALNKKSYLEAIYQGIAEGAKNPIPPTMWSYDSRTGDFEHNPKRAKELLVKAGHEKGFDIDLWYLPVSRPYNPNGKKMAELMQKDLAEVGIRARLVTFDWPTYLAKSKGNDHGLIQMGWTGDNGDPDNFLNVLLGCTAVKSGANLARWCDADFDQLIVKAKSVSQQKVRADLYQKAQARFHQQVPWVPIAHAKVYRAMSERVRGFQISPFGLDILKDVSLE